MSENPPPVSIPGPSPVSRAADPEFIPSLKMLMEEQQYSATDVALMFDVSRERVRQWCKAHDIEQGGRNRSKRSRIWDDGANQFRPVNSGEYDGLIREVRERERRETRAVRRARMVERMRACAIQLGRAPSLAELYFAVTGEIAEREAAGAMLCGLWGLNRGSSKGVLAEIRAAAGIEGRPAGAHGHLGNRPESTD